MRIIRKSALKKALTTTLISLPLTVGFLATATAFGQATAQDIPTNHSTTTSTQAPEHNLSLLDKAAKVALDVLVKPTTWAWNKAQSLTGGGSNEELKQKTQLIKFRINNYQTMLKSAESQLRPYAPEGNLKNLKQLVLKEEKLLMREKRLSALVEKNQKHVNETSLLLSLFETAPTPLKTSLARGTGALGGAAVGYLVSRYVIERLLDAGHTDLAATLSKVQALRKEIKELTASIKKATESKPAKKSEQASATELPAATTDDKETANKQRTALGEDRKRLADLRHECSVLEQELLKPQSRSTFASIASTVIPVLCGVFGGIVGYKAVEYFTRTTPRVLSLEDQQKAEQLRLELAHAKALYEKYQNQHSAVTQILKPLQALPTDAKDLLAQYMDIQNEVRSLKEMLEKASGAAFEEFIRQLEFMLNPS
ncbi:TPA: hypothetical protein DDZ86_02085 [Candidatus Dependentiae bacterium]|nr:MAG: hypothetical protein UW09_C0001G0222 [candidate division TM6 bacterium GW2011_GWF2_43_87]HBL98413.1 hypothetical protein [Candidatus Dependentiae bacterium]